ncbi:MAG: hypothetical protein ACE5MI_11345 [Acidimicrobiia bacterium]
MIETPIRDKLDTGAKTASGAKPRPVAVPGRSLDDPIRSGVAALAGLAWIVFLPISLAAQPPVDPAAPVSALAEVVALVFTLMLFGSVAGLTLRRRWGLLATIGGGVTMMTAASLCYLTGHTGTWIAIQLVAGIGIAASGRLLDRV